MLFTDPMFPSHRFQWLKPANGGAKAEAEREAVGVFTFYLLTCLIALTEDLNETLRASLPLTPHT